MCDYDLPDAYEHSERKARKQHRCCECHGTISTGEHYHYHSGIWNGQPASYKVCRDCDELRSLVEGLTSCRAPFEGLVDELIEMSSIGSGAAREQFNSIAKKRGGIPMKVVQ